MLVMSGRPEKLRLTLVYVLQGDQVLLGLKKRGFGEGIWNGFGGKLEKGESVADAAIREVKEECGLIIAPDEINYRGVIDCVHILAEGDHRPCRYEVHLFDSKQFKGEIEESEEMKPRWFPICELPYDKMWPGDQVWHPIWMSGKKFKAHFLYEGFDKLLEHSIDLVNELPV